jgi:hypothetical protein
VTATVADLGARALRRLGVAAVAAQDRPASAFAATVTMDEIARLTLEWLGVVASGETADVSDTTRAVEKAKAVHDDLAAQGLVIWGNDYVIPRFVSEDYVMLTALHLGTTFGKVPADPEAAGRIQQRIRLKAMLMQPRVAEQAVQDVHSTLAAQGKVRWTIFDIPQGVEQAYVVMAANILAPQFGMQPDEVGQQRARRDILMAIAMPPTGEPMRGSYF